MSSMSKETPPQDIDANVRTYLTRIFTSISIALNKTHEFVERKEKPNKPQIGDLYYFGDPVTHDYDAAITSQGFWGYVEILPATDPRTAEWIKLS